MPPPDPLPALPPPVPPVPAAPPAEADPRHKPERGAAAVPTTFPPLIVIPEIVTVLPELTVNTRVTLLPLTLRLAAPGPVIVRFLLTVNSVSSRIELTPENVIV